MIDLKQFCGKEQSRFYLNTPVSRGDFTYATNGHIMVRVPRIGEWPEEPLFPDCEKVMPTHEGVTFRAIAHLDVPKPPITECALCDGTGHPHECPTCECKCERCDGTGEFTEPMSVAFRGGIIAVEYLILIASLPGAEMPDRITEPHKPQPFRFDGGVGAVMLRTRECEHHVEDCNA